MRFKRIAVAGTERPVLAVARGTQWFAVEAALRAVGAAWPPASVPSGLELIALLGHFDRLRVPLENGLAQLGAGQALPESANALLPFEPRSYRDFMLSERHVIDAGRGYARRFMPGAFRIASLYEKLLRKPFPAFRPKPLWYRQPIYYMGNHLSFVPDGSTIACPAYSQALDYELELGFVLARPLLDATPEQALAAIGGFVVFNDVSARDVQRAEMQSGFGPQKSKHFCNVMSVELVTADEVLPWIEALDAEVRINGEIVSRAATRGMQFSIGEALAHVSRGESLHPGEFFGSGTLPGGSGMENGHWPQAGDLLELRIDRVGSLSNRIGVTADTQNPGRSSG